MSADGDNGTINYYLGLNKFITDGISAMNDNGEADGYKNDSLVGSLSYKINDNFKIENSLRLTDSFTDYDAVNKKSRHKYTLEEFGLTEKQVGERFKKYTTQFDL